MKKHTMDAMGLTGQELDTLVERLFEDAFSIGVSAEDLAFTADTFADFDKATDAYNECSTPRYNKVDGFNTMEFAKVQPRKADPRRSMYIIDLGPSRVVYF